MKKHSIWGIISISLLILGLISFIPFTINDELSKYIYHPSLQFSDNLNNLIIAIMLLCLLLSFITGLVAIFMRNSKKTLPLISISILSMFIFIFFVFLIDSVFPINVKYGVVTNYGIFNVPTIKISKNINKELPEQRVLLKNTNIITGKIGTIIGFNYVIAGEPDEKEITLKEVFNYPDSGLIINNSKVTADTFYTNVKLNKLNFLEYTIEHDYELVPGSLKIDLYYKGKKLLSQDFLIKKGM